MDSLPKDPLLAAQLMRTIGYAPFAGADIGECLAAAARGAGSLDAWYEAWLATAERTAASAADSATAGDHEGARAAWLRSANYFRTAGVMVMGAPLDPRLVHAHRREVECFRSAVALLDQPPELLTVPFEGRTLPAYFFRPAADDVARPTLLLTNGYDGTAEELYFATGAAALLRGYNVLTFDGPGQGAMIIDEGVVFRPDWENVVTPVLDVLLGQAGVDPGRVVLMGLSFGGYLAPRAATREHRLAACVSDCGPYDLSRATARQLPGPLARQLPDGRPWMLALLDRLARTVMAKPTAGWALRRNLMVHGLSSPLEYFRTAPEYSLVGLEQAITCPTFVCGTDADDLSTDARVFYDALTCPKHFVEFKATDGAGQHCEGGARTAFHQQVFGWLEGILG